MSDFARQIYNLFIDLKFKYDSSADDFAILKLAVIDKKLVPMYEEKIMKHNLNFKNNKFMDSGFDLFVGNDIVIDSLFKTNMVDLGVRAELIECKTTTSCKPKTIPFYLYPRSSMSKTPLMLANHTGIIDAGYRGNLMVALRSLYFDNDNCYTIKSGTRLFQICDPKLRPIYVQMVDESELSNTERGVGGFGSTGV
jgi:dUTP pyrophosphatase